MPDQYFVVGNPVAHSLSPWIHAHFAKQRGVDLAYGRKLIETGHFESEIKSLIAQGCKGVNVTVPYKHEAFALATEKSPAAEFAQASNTLKFLPEGGVYAHNTDGEGLCCDLNGLLAPSGLSLSKVNVLMIGAGGAASGCVQAFQQAGVQTLIILNRTAQKAETLALRAKGLGLQAQGGGLEAWFEQSQLPLVMVNASSSSLKAEVPAINTRWYENAVLAYDMMYSAKPTAFMVHAKDQAGHAMQLSDGLGMLVNQAALSFELWTGSKPDAQFTLHDLRAYLKQTVKQD